MGWFGNLFKPKTDTIKGLVEAVPSAIRNIRNTFSKSLPPDEAAAFEIKMTEIENKMLEGQAEINKIEAGSSRLFVAGWRPFIGWILGVVILNNFVVGPFVSHFTKITFPVLSFAELSPILVGMLGIVGVRTWEKIKGVQDKH